MMSKVATIENPRALSRLTGGIYLCIMVGGMFTEAFVRDQLVVTSNAVATAHNIANNQILWRWGVAVDVVTTMCDVAVAGLLLVLLAPVNRTASIVAAFFRLIYAATMAASALFLFGPLMLLKASGNLTEAQNLALFSLRLHSAGFDVALSFFGIHIILVGWLIARSTFLPRWLGASLSLAGACYTANSLIGFIVPATASDLSPWILLPGFLSEAAFTLWLLVVGVNNARWTSSQVQQARLTP